MQTLVGRCRSGRAAGAVTSAKATFRKPQTIYCGTKTTSDILWCDLNKAAAYLS